MTGIATPAADMTSAITTYKVIADVMKVVLACRPGMPPAALGRLEKTLSGLCEGRIRRGPAVPVEHLSCWLLAVAACPDPSIEAAMIYLLTPVTPEQIEVTSRWFALGDLGPLAYAAGLTLAEAEHQAGTDQWDADHLGTLVGLRGWRFLPVR